jgi:hypothetical protein
MRFDLLIQNLRTGSRYIDLQKRLENYKFEVTTYPPFWRLFNYKLRNETLNFSSLKFSSNANPTVTDGTPGIYLFVLKPLPEIFSEYSMILYVGISEEGLIERLNKGYRTPSMVKQRPHVQRMILDYGDYLYWYYSPLIGKTNAELKEIESNLIGYFCDPPINRKDQPIPISNASRSKMY